ncbi:sialidase-1-like isoform X2 [Ornithodoros turicata]
MEQVLWMGDEVTPGVHSFRIPLITYTPMGHLLAISEARKHSDADVGPKFIAVRRSEDGGVTWSRTTFIADGGTDPDAISLGVVLVDDETKNIFLMYTECAHYVQCAVSSVMMMSSSDDGATWGSARNLSQEIGTKMFAPGPGTGIQKKFPPYKGRLIVCGHGTIEEDGVFCVVSDDHGDTWKNGGSLIGIPYAKPKKTGDFTPDECQAYELPNGNVVINIRNEYFYHCRCRIVAYSTDGCESLPVENVRFDEELPDPAVAAGVLYENGVTYFTNPASEFSRVDLTLRWSYNSGGSWEETGLRIWPGPSGYSCITSSYRVQDSIFILYEKGKATSTESISLVKIKLNTA